MTADDEHEKKVGRGVRCHQAMARVMQVLSEEFADLGPPEMVFLLSWMQHRYLDEVEVIVRERSQSRPPNHAN